jgi:hypothetical protein
MNYNQARRLLSDGDVEAIRRAAWIEKDPDAALMWDVDGTGRGYIQFVSHSTELYDFGPWSARQEDLDADDWEAVNEVTQDSESKQNPPLDKPWTDPYTGETFLPPETVEEIRKRLDKGDRESPAL